MTEIEQHRENRRVEIEQHLAAGGNVRQGFPPRWEGVWPECSPFLPQRNTPEFLATHIEAREFSFGMETVLVQGR